MDQLYKGAKFDRPVDIVEKPAMAEFQQYWSQSSFAHKQRMAEWAASTGRSIEEHVEMCGDVSLDYSATVNAADCLPMTLLFRTYNTVKIVYTRLLLEKMGFKTQICKHTHLHWFAEEKDQKYSQRKLIVIFPQFSGEYFKLSAFAQLRDQFDILFVCPLGIQFSWFQTPGLHTDSLQDYLPIILKYQHIIPVTWSAGNFPFQVLDRYLHLSGLGSKISALIRMDPLGYPSSNFLVYCGVPMKWWDLHALFFKLASHASPSWFVGFWNHAGCLGLSYLIKTCHGYIYLKSGRMLRATKLVPSPYPEFHFTAAFDPMWSRGNPIFDHDRNLLGKVTEFPVEGFHGLWLNSAALRERVFPVIRKFS